MADIWHNWGSDIAASPAGDVQVVTGATETQQRVIRRLMTAPGDYVQHPTYGAGLGQYIGSPASGVIIAGVIKRQMRAEASVSQNPPPTVALTSDNNGTVTATITYVSLLTGLTETLVLPIGGQ